MTLISCKIKIQESRSVDDEIAVLGDSAVQSVVKDDLEALKAQL